MNAPVITRRHLVAGGVAALGTAALPVGIAEALAARGPCTGLPTPARFDPAGFLADLRAAGCRVCLALPATVFRPEDDRPSYLISWPPRTEAFQGYCAAMLKWADAMAACPDPHERVTARLVELNGWAA